MNSNERSPRSIPKGTVTGLGVVDAVRLELLPIQIPGLMVELESLRNSLENALQHADATLPDDDTTRDDEIGARKYALRLLDLMLAEVPVASGDERITFVGPTGMTTELVTGALRQTVDDFSGFLDDRKNPTFLDRLREHSALVLAWVETHLDLHEVERFNFDPEADPNPNHFW